MYLMKKMNIYAVIHAFLALTKARNFADTEKNNDICKNFIIVIVF